MLELLPALHMGHPEGNSRTLHEQNTLHCLMLEKTILQAMCLYSGLIHPFIPLPIHDFAMLSVFLQATENQY